MGKIIKCLTTTAAIVTMWGIMSVGASAAPYSNQKHELAQPDGSKVQVKISGDEYFQQVESLDGYTLCRDKDGWICYAKLNSDESDYVSTGEVYKGNDTFSDMKIAIKNENSNEVKNTLSKHIKIKKEAIKQKSDSVRKKLHGMEYSPSARKATQSNDNTNWLLESKAQATSSQNVHGLTILVDFPDKKSDISKSEIEQFFNGVGYTGFNNNGSIRDYYYDVSGGKITYTNDVKGFYTAKHPKTYYDDINEETGTYAKAGELSNEVFQWLKTSGIDTSSITKNSEGYATAVNILYAGKAEAGWAKGLWPHQDWYSGGSINGLKIQKFQMSDIGNDISIYTICHESGHMIYGYPDFYDYDGDSMGTGPYSLMSGSANEKNPTPPDPYCRDIISGWNTPISMNSYGDGTTFTAVADGTGHQYSYKWSGKNSNEYFLIENIQKTGRYADLSSEGLAIWHIDEKGDNSKNSMTANSHYLLSLEQADGKFDLEHNKNYYDNGDLFRAGYKDSFGDSTTPNSKWWNGTSSSLKISQISKLGNEMTFVQGTPGTNPTPDPTNTGTNIAGQATASASYVSDWEKISALNDGVEPSSSSDRSGAVYGNWPQTGTQWVQYTFNKNVTISSCDVYWFKDGQGIDVPASYRIAYWDGKAWQDVKNPKGLGTEINKYNTTTFTPVSTNAIAIQMDSKGSSSTGIIEWKVNGK
ncbi:F5/8 type C domain protein [Clostridium puniceum]|uniref:F5/8 type C domain protein n=1 Tax=Clostridium puniceum TaxID=29367 RepID=A0A1S8T5I0_9CLOT|nr:M6 family metalloprotease domain-containing protein [Clostridium puniceum]OOM72735.1 F5/8 type C domain protein [Clostridium puniceum]